MQQLEFLKIYPDKVLYIIEGCMRLIFVTWLVTVVCKVMFSGKIKNWPKHYVLLLFVLNRNNIFAQAYDCIQRGLDIFFNEII